MKVNQLQKPQAKNHTDPQKSSVGNAALALKDNRSVNTIQAKFSGNVSQRVDSAQTIGGGYLVDNRPLQKKANNTGLPDQLKAGIENFSGHSLDDVEVHYNSSKPAQLHAHAFAQGNQIHIAPGQEKHLPHEAWHVVQQKEGRVKPTIKIKNGIAVNNDKSLEHEADVMGTKSLSLITQRRLNTNSAINTPNNVVQRVWWYLNEDKGSPRLSQEKQSNDVTQDEAYNYVVRHYNKRSVEIVIFSAEEVNEEKGWVRLPLSQLKPGHDLKSITKEPEKVEPITQESIVQEEMAKEDIKSGLIKLDEARVETNKLLYYAAGAFFPLMTIWQTFHSRRGTKTGGRGQHATDKITGVLDLWMRNGNNTLRTLKTANAVQQKPVWEGFKLGFDFRPMPIATRYARISELATAFRQISFLLLANKDDINHIIKESFGNAGATKGENEKARKKPENDYRLVKHGLQSRYKVLKGIGMGAASSSAAFTVIGTTGFSNPLMYMQMPWDVVHILNAFAQNTKYYMQVENTSLRTANQQMLSQMELLGRSMLSKENIGKALIRAVFKR